MEYVNTITAMNVTPPRISSEGTVSLSSNDLESYASAKNHIHHLTFAAKDLADTAPKVLWTSFHDSLGNLIEKCAIEWYRDGFRHTDVVWVKRGRKW